MTNIRSFSSASCGFRIEWHMQAPCFPDSQDALSPEEAPSWENQLPSPRLVQTHPQLSARTTPAVPPGHTHRVPCQRMPMPRTLSRELPSRLRSSAPAACASRRPEPLHSFQWKQISHGISLLLFSPPSPSFSPKHSLPVGS